MPSYRKPWNCHQDERLAALVRQQLSTTIIATRLGRTPNDICRRIQALRERGTLPPKKAGERRREIACRCQ